MEYTIRKADTSDLPHILNLVKELAIYEKEPKAVTATLYDYEKNFEEKVFDALVAEVDGEVIGTALYYLTWSTWRGRMVYLEDFVITKNHRRKGVGQLLFNAFLKEAENLDAVLAKWQVLDWNEPAILFYEKNNAIIEKEWWSGKIILKN